MNRTFKKIINMIIGTILIGVGIGLCRICNFGNDAYSAYNFSISELLNIKYGIINLVMNCVLFIPMFFLLRKKINIGTIVNMIGVGFVVDGLIYLYGILNINELHLIFKIIISVIGVVIESFGIAFYIKADMGIAPYDALPIIIEDKMNISFKYGRIIVDGFFMIIAFVISNIILHNNSVGIFTLVTMVVVGPLVSFFRKILNKKESR